MIAKIIIRISIRVLFIDIFLIITLLKILFLFSHTRKKCYKIPQTKTLPKQLISCISGLPVLLITLLF